MNSPMAGLALAKDMTASEAAQAIQIFKARLKELDLELQAGLEEAVRRERTRTEDFVIGAEEQAEAEERAMRRKAKNRAT